MVLNALTTLPLSLLKVMGCSSVSDAHIYMHYVSSVRDWWKKNESGCSWDVQDAQDALKTDPLKLQKMEFGQKNFFHEIELFDFATFFGLEFFKFSSPLF